jgi:hypothetical protein
MVTGLQRSPSQIASGRYCFSASGVRTTTRAQFSWLRASGISMPASPPSSRAACASARRETLKQWRGKRIAIA